MYCQSCNRLIGQAKNASFIVKCKCNEFNRFRYIENKEKEFKSKVISNIPEFNKIEIDNGLLYTYHFHPKDLNKIKNFSPKTGQALEQFLYYDKESLNNQEKNILYKFKAHSIKEIDYKIENLSVKKRFIELLRFLDF